MLHEYDLHLKPLETKHLSSLFLEYIQIPIVDHETILPPTEHRHKVYDNYDENGLSPRKKRSSKIY